MGMDVRLRQAFILWIIMGLIIALVDQYTFKSLIYGPLWLQTLILACLFLACKKGINLYHRIRHNRMNEE